MNTKNEYSENYDGAVKYFRILIYLSLIITGVSWWMAENFGIIALPIFGIPAVWLTAHTPGYRLSYNPTRRNLLFLVGIVATIYTFSITVSGMADEYNDLFATKSENPENAQLTAMVALFLLTVGLMGIWIKYLSVKQNRNNYLKSKKP